MLDHGNTSTKPGRRIGIGSMLLSVLLLVAGLMVSTPAQAIVGGKVSSTGLWSVRVYEDGEPICTGVLVDHEWVLTAGHCVRFENRRITFRIGNLDQRRGKEVARLPHETFFAKTADVALVKIPKVTTTPIQLPARGSRQDVNLPKGTTLRAYGWGATCEPQESTCQANLLRTATVKIIDHSLARCDLLAGTGDYCVARGSGLPVGGDSGGPGTVSAASGPVLVGILTSSDRESTSAYANVHQLRTWITTTICKHPSSH